MSEHRCQQNATEGRSKDQDGVEDGVPQVHPEEGGTEGKRKKERHRYDEVDLAVASFDIGMPHEPEGTDTHAVDENASQGQGEHVT